MNSTPTGYCVVGIGSHARTKLIPAIAATGQELRGLVSRQRPEVLPAAPVFPTIETAIAALPPDTVFLIASPPGLHFPQAMHALAAGRDVFIEKPAFVTTGEARLAAAEATRSGAVMVEAFMHRHTRLFTTLQGEWSLARADVVAIDVAFIVPSLPANTFRQSAEIGASVLFDIGSYAVSLIVDLGLSLDGLRLMAFDRSNGTDELLRFGGRSGDLDLAIRIGVGATYENSVTLRRRDGRAVLYAPFFYGRPGDRTVTVTVADSVVEELILAEGNGFQAMLSMRRDEWLGSQARRLRDMITVTACLERLSEALLALRRDG